MKLNRLRAYGSTALGTTALLASQSDAATVVDVNATTYNTGLSGIGTIGRTGNGGVYASAAVTTSNLVMMPAGAFFRRASDSAAVTSSGFSTNGFQYSYKGIPVNQARNGAILSSSDNWFYAKSDASPNQQVWLQFQFGGQGDGTGFSILKAVFPGTPGELTNALAASAVPEPSALALLSLGASGLLIRRRKQAA